MSLRNTIIWLLGSLAEGVVFCVVMLSVRRLTKPAPRKPQRPIRMTATIRRHELPVPPRKELTR